jgi:hypothetical protein
VRATTGKELKILSPSFYQREDEKQDFFRKTKPNAIEGMKGTAYF